MEKLTYFFYYEKDEKVPMFNTLEKLLKEAKFYKKNIYLKDFDNTLDYLHLYLTVPSYLYKINTVLLNFIISESISKKSNLYSLSYKNNKSKTLEYFMETYNSDSNVNYKELFKNNQPWYIKLDKLSRGEGNILVDNYDDFLKITKNVKHYLDADHKKLERFFKKNNQTTFILNKYIINPLLFKEKKFHIRIYLINYINSKNIIKSYLSRYGKIITAKDKYIPADFGNKDIHDSHIKSTDNDYMFPNDLEKEYGKTKVHNYFNQIKIILKYIKTIQVISNYNETQNGYTIHGCDFMITSDNQVKLIEINKRSGFDFMTRKMENFLGNYLFKNIFNEIFTDVFNLEKVPVEEKFIKL
jgi:hypothetical protein